MTIQEDTLNSEDVYSALTLDEYKEFSYSDKTDSIADLTIDFDCAVLIYPGKDEIEEMKTKYGNEDFYVIADDNNWYQGTAIEKLASLGIKMATIHGDSLRFKGEKQKWGFDLKRDSLTGWNLILFSRTKGPEVVSTVDLTTEQIKEYFTMKE